MLINITQPTNKAVFLPVKRPNRPIRQQGKIHNILLSPLSILLPTSLTVDEDYFLVLVHLTKNIATGETSQAITPFHLLDYFHFFD